jgi:hypothetical protein
MFLFSDLHYSGRPPLRILRPQIIRQASEFVKPQNREKIENAEILENSSCAGPEEEFFMKMQRLDRAG